LDGVGQNDAREPVAAPGRREDAHTRVVAAPQDDVSASRGGRVGERHAPRASAGDADQICAPHAVSRRILMLLGQWDGANRAGRASLEEAALSDLLLAKTLACA
jgi:hypothetical protein